MAAIDPLLGIVQMKKASGLVLASDEVPSLLVEGARVPLTMPALSSGRLDDLMQSVLGPEHCTTLRRTGAATATYRSDSHGTFVVHAESTGGKITVTLERAGATPSERPSGRAAPPAGTDAALWTVLDQAVERRASDVLLSAGARPLIRVEGTLTELAAPAWTDADLRAAADAFLDDAQRGHLDATGSVDFALVRPRDAAGEGLRFRANLFRHARGSALSVRPIWSEIPSFDDLRLPSTLGELMRARTGLVLIAGATGAGKSTTLAALLEQVNRTRACHIITLEDPIEYVFPRRQAAIHQREVGRDVDSFATGLRAALRENPDIILVGEMRDQETIRLALTAAETGHLVLSTLHSGSAVMAIERLVDSFPEGEKALLRAQLAGVLRHVVAQQLLPGARGGLVPALEILQVTHAIAAQIREGRMHMVGAQMEIGAEKGMNPMERALADLVRGGHVTRSVAVGAALNPDVLERLLDERSPGGRGGR